MDAFESLVALLLRREGYWTQGSFKVALTKAERYKLLSEKRLRDVVFKRLARQLVESGLCQPEPRIQLCLAAGHLSSTTDRDALQEHFEDNGWLLFDDVWIRDRLISTADARYENDIAHVATKILMCGTN